jgi:hypothetical protein
MQNGVFSRIPTATQVSTFPNLITHLVLGQIIQTTIHAENYLKK